MTTASERLVAIRSKIERAKHHVCELESRIAAFEIAKDTIRCDQNTETGERVFILQRQLPTEFSLIIGDAVHNLRSALDHLACGVAAASGGSIKKAAFPVYEELTRFEKRPTTQIPGVSPEIVSLFESVQPYHAGYALLGVISEMDNADKHRVLVVGAFMMRGIEFGYTNQAMLASLDPITRAAVEPYMDNASPASDGTPHHILIPNPTNGETELARIVWKDGPPAQMDDYLHFAFDVAINEPEITEPMEVALLLRNQCELTSRIVDMFSEHLNDPS